MIMSVRAQNLLHAVHKIGQKGLTSIQAITLCNIEGDAGQGLYQVADWAFDGRAKYGEIPICGKCAQTAAQLMKAPPK